MSLVSKVKQEDAQTLRDLWDTVGVGMNSYMKTENPAMLQATQEVMAFAERLKEKMRVYDYTEDDARRERLDKKLLTHGNQNKREGVYNNQEI
jgi:hypothetical protein